MKWFKRCLNNLRVSGYRAIVVGHNPIVPEAANLTHIIWDVNDLTHLFREYCDVIRVYLCGHYHPGGYAFHDKIHHITVQSILEARPGTESFGVMDVYHNSIVIQGFGAVKSYQLPV
jgi:manganese-dependent ADP-ribose/CDP-alcohol diphosphatase